MDYTVDTNIITALMKNDERIKRKLQEIVFQGKEVFINGISYYEIKRGLLAANATFCAKTGISSWQIYQLFDGWREACESAGLKPHYQNVRVDDDVLFEEMRRVFLRCSGICTRTKFDKLSKYSVATYKSRFGQWLVVKHLNDEGFIITAFFISKDKIRKTGREVVYGKEDLH